ncbi:WecB/TagA/CpsF family glycosyltransferase [Candidatus Roizmanbacteria bacterium]|nr:WecB/TagA/CpsF family glycosyltransferase [Candidatus Roizmanbacteria bacterium]
MNHSSYYILGVRIDDVTLQETLEKIKRSLENSPRSDRVLPVVTINPEFIMLARLAKPFRTILNSAFLCVPDGVGILLASLLIGSPLRTRVTGIELVYSLTKEAAMQGWTVGFLGGQNEVAEKTKEYFISKYPKLTAWADNGPWIENNISSVTYQVSSELLERIRKTNILFVAMGAPKQEYFISNLQNTKYKIQNTIVAVGVGGSFDEIAGVVPKTPQFIDTLGLKWLFRLITQPWRFRRQLRLLQFVYLIFVDRIKKSL